MIAGCLCAKANLGTYRLGVVDDLADHPPYSGILFIKDGCKTLAVPVDAKRQLGQIVQPDRKPIEVVQTPQPDWKGLRT